MAQTRVRQELHLPVRPGLSVRRVFDWEAAGLAGLWAAFCAMLLEIGLMPLAASGSLWRAPRMVASFVFGGTLANPGHGALLAITLFTHLTLGLFWGRAIAGLVFGRPRREAAWIGGLAGVALYFVNFYGIGALLPRIGADRNWVWLLCHVAFGVIAARTFLNLERVSYERTVSSGIRPRAGSPYSGSRTGSLR